MHVFHDDLLSEGLLKTHTLHYMNGPDQIVYEIDRIRELKELRADLRSSVKADYIIWEPASFCCDPQHVEDIFKAVKLVNCFSPNHLELLNIFDYKSSDNRFTKIPEDIPDKEILENLARRFVREGIGAGKSGCIVVRAGQHGCMVCTCGQDPVWLPPYYDMDFDGKTQRELIVDPTGAGNAFLGGFAIGMQSSGNIIEAAQWGTVAASFALEQTGLPKLTISPDGKELWNGVNFKARYRKYEESKMPPMNSSGQLLPLRPTWMTVWQ